MRAWVLPVLILLSLPLLAGCLDDTPPADEASAPPPATLGDPLADGPFLVEELDWDLGPRIVSGDGGTYFVRLHGNARAPEGTGPFPVVLLMHGRHSTCRIEPIGFESLVPACPDAPPVATPVDSYTGYDGLARHLASHGFVVLSASANDINDSDGFQAFDDAGATARGRVVITVLDALDDAQAGSGEGGLEALSGRMDLSRVGLMGHSRGGEGVARAWTLARDEGATRDGTRIGAVFALAPTDFRRWDVRGTPFATLLPYCDGDVSNLQGAWMYDDARADNDAPIHQFLALGANHNYYNTVWTRSDWTNRGDPWCDEDSGTSGRDTPEAQRTHGTALMGSFFRHHLGGEADLAPFLSGDAPWPVPGIVTSDQPARAQSVADDGHSTGGAFITGDVKTTRCAGLECPAKDTYTVASQTAIQWTGPGAYHVAVAPAGRDLSFRIGLDPATVSSAELDDMSLLVLSGSPGNATQTHWPLATLGAFVPPGDDAAKTLLHTLRIPLPAGAFEVALTFGEGDGIVQVADWIYV